MAKKRTTKKRKSKSATETKPRTKSQIFGEIAETTGLTKREVAFAILEVLAANPQTVTLPTGTIRPDPDLLRGTT